MADDRGLNRWRYRLGRRIEPGDVWLRQRAKAWWWVAGFIAVALVILLWLSLAGGGPDPGAPAR